MAETKRLTVQAAEELLGLYFPVLDHGFVAFVDYMGGDSSIDDAARVSYGAGTRRTSDERNLLRYLMRKAHTSPIEMVELKFHCKMPIFVARQWIRHRTANVNEYSGRYSLLPLQFYTPAQEKLGIQASNNKQGRAEAVADKTHADAVQKWNAQRALACENYEWLLAEDVARELARIDLPLSTYTEWYWKIDLHNLLHFLTLRVDPHAQYEIQAYGLPMACMVKALAPQVFEAWIDYRVCGRSFSRQEMNVLIEQLSGSPHPPTIDHLTERLQEEGLGKREVAEFFAKLNDVEVPNFALDPSTALTAEHFAEEARKHTPVIDGPR
jgi:thymidylate synthase (FAD)